MKSKICRNSPCPCGSGEKYKKCCMVKKTKNFSEPLSDNNPVTLKNDGFPGCLQHIVAVPVYKDKSDPRNTDSPQGLPGDYKVEFILSRPGFNIHPEYQLSFAAGLNGDSHLAITQPAFTPPSLETATQIKIYAVVEGQKLVFHGFPNERGYLAKICIDKLFANNFDEARNFAYRCLAPSLSNWSLHLDIPLNIYQVEVTELRTNSVSTSLTPSFINVPHNVRIATRMTVEMRAFASLYREALNSNSVAYQYLCFYKIIESIFERRKRLGEERAKSGNPFPPLGNLPSNAEEAQTWLNSIFPVRPDSYWSNMHLSSILYPESLGKKIGNVVENILEPLRKKIAHALSESGEWLLSTDEALHINEIHKWLPLAKCISRKLIKIDFQSEFLTDLPD